MTDEIERTNLSEQELFDRLVEVRSEVLKLTSDIGQLKKDNKFNKKNNPKGLSSADIGLIDAAAKIEAQNTFEEFQAKNAELQAKFKELTGYGYDA